MKIRKEDIEQFDRGRLQTFFAFSKIPFTKYVWSSKMFQAKSQQELLQGLHYSLEVRGISLVIGSPGVGKSITLRKFKDELSPQHYQPYYLWNTRISPVGFMRSLCRTFQLPPAPYIADMFDSVNAFLGGLEETMGKYPVLIFDECDNLSREVLERIRLLMNFEMDSDERFSLIMCGTEKLQNLLREHAHTAFRQRITYCHKLRPFSFDDARAYVNYHLSRVDGAPEIFTDGAVNLMFQMSRGLPRVMNQVAIQSLIHAAIHRNERIDENLIRRNVDINLLIELPDDEKSAA
ncbi:MAG: AAA family ATPase [Candidatus Eremiobacteraeota bacterium]|nr:AAA family ATPase [Candidatus Eremiobacteraeota bacterium]